MKRRVSICGRAARARAEDARRSSRSSRRRRAAAPRPAPSGGAASDASPSNVRRTFAPAQAPRSIRAVEPEFMQSRVAAGDRRGRRCTTTSSPSSARCARRARPVPRAWRDTSRPGLRLRDAQRLVAAGARDQRPVRNRLVAGNADAAAQRAGMKGRDLAGHERLISDKESIIIS